jgi:hypothetical protein
MILELKKKENRRGMKDRKEEKKLYLIIIL